MRISDTYPPPPISDPLPSKIEKIPRGIQSEKSSKDTISLRNMVLTIGAQVKPKRGTEPGVRKGKSSPLACHIRCKCSMETTHNSMKVKLSIKVMIRSLTK